MFPSSYCSKNKTWQGADFPLMYHRDVTVGNVLLTWLSRYDNRVMQVRSACIFLIIIRIK